MKKYFVLLMLISFFNLVFISPSSAATILPSDDIYVLSWMPTYSNNNATTISAGVTSSGTIHSYLKFDLSAYDTADIGSVTLNLRSLGPNGVPTVGVYTTGNNTWVELGTNWNNQPGLTGTPVNTVVSAANTWYAWDVTSFALLSAGGQFSLGISAPSGSVSFNSFENGTAAYRPYLEITQPAPVPIPAGAWLLGSGLVGLMTLKRRLRH